MIKSIPLQPGQNIQVINVGVATPIIDYIVPDGFVAVVTIVIELYQKFPKGIYVPGRNGKLPGEGRPT